MQLPEDLGALKRGMALIGSVGVSDSTFLTYVPEAAEGQRFVYLDQRGHVLCCSEAYARANFALAPRVISGWVAVCPEPDEDGDYSLGDYLHTTEERARHYEGDGPAIVPITITIPPV